MDGNITHETKKGTSEFGLTNTNKLVRQYEYATGRKTGSTGVSKILRFGNGKEADDDELIAVVMAADTSKEIFMMRVKMMNYGFGNVRCIRTRNR